VRWLWFAAPVVALLVYLATTRWPTAEERRWRKELRRWLDELLGPLPATKKSAERGRLVRAVPGDLARLVADVGGGARIADVVLVPKNAYLVVRGPDGATVTGHQTVLCKLAKPAPRMQIRPLPVVEGRPADNPGISFSKDPEMMDLFIVEGPDPKAIGKWLKPSLREALKEMPRVWARTDASVLAVTLHGATDADGFDELVAVADAFFEEHGAKRGVTLFGDAAAHRERARTVASRHRAVRSETGAAAPAPLSLRAQAAILDLALYALAGVLVAAVVGAFPRFHPQLWFEAPDVVPGAPWQGGWTTKGVGAFIVAEALLVGLFAYQAYLGAWYGQSIGKRLLGARVVRRDGKPLDFVRGVLLRTWIFGAIPLFVAAALSRPLHLATFVRKLPTLPVALGGVAAIALAALPLLVRKQGARALGDYVAGTMVVSAPAWRWPSYQLVPPARGVDPILARQLVSALVLLLVVVAANVLAWWFDAGFWIY
jgi:uncharacterized RDD family membrane protein YckC